MADINDLLARLKASSGTPAPSPSSAMHHPQPQSGYQPPYVSSPSVERSGLLSPGIPAGGSMRNFNTQEGASSDRTANLLNLLKFNQPTGNAGPRSVSANNPPSSISDLLGGAHKASANIPPAANEPSSASNPQSLLLNLLNRPDAASPASMKVEQKAAHQPSAEPVIAFQPAEITRGKSPFTYVNPFEQLAASAAEEPVTSPQHDLPASTVEPTGRSAVEALLGIGATDGTSSSKPLSKAHGEDLTAKSQAQTAAKDIKQEIAQATSSIADVEQGMTPEMARGFEAKINEIANGQAPVADSWEAADAAESKAEADRGVPVYNFPMKPFVAINVNNLPQANAVREDVVMKIASLRKDFDQIDRTLASATTNFIVYAMSKSGGLRVIRQEDGKNVQIFKGANNQIFNLSVSGAANGSAPTAAESVLGTGVNGSVYWTPVQNTENFGDEDLDKSGFIFPPLPQAEENTSGAQLKTRAKLSSKHPEFFAVGRGKSIHIVWPEVVIRNGFVDKSTRVVDTAKYLDYQSLKVATGKAGKDFSFSADDTVIVSLDKAGRLKFWDIREHTDPSVADPAGGRQQVEVKTPIMIIPTTSPNEKSWATSVMFVDREKSVAKGQALRYLLVGLKQNHTLQLWDLCLGKVVQEVNFPHENETDPICSIAWYGKSNIIAVGHPTRNSVFLIHLSLPRHNIPTISQALLMKRLAISDKTLPKAESTAIMSGIRELSLASVGQLLSLDLAAAPPGAQSETLFDAYVMHTRGVTCLSLKSADLGWTSESKVIEGHDAVVEQVVEVSELRQPLTGADNTESEVTATPPTKATPLKSTVGPTPIVARPVEVVKPANVPAAACDPPISLPTPIVAKPSQPKVPAAEPSPSRPPAQVAKVEQPATPKQSSEVTKSNGVQPSTPSSSTEATLDASALANTMSEALSTTLSSVLSQVLGDLFENLYRRLDDDKRVAEASGSAKQDAVLRLVSSTLTDNVEKSLNRIISGSIEKAVIPAMSKTVSAAVERKVADTVAQQLQATLSKDLQAALAAPIAAAMQDPKVVSSLHSQLTSKVASHVETVFTTTLNQTITPAFQKLAVSSASKMTADMEKRVGQQVQDLSAQRQIDAKKIDKLTSLTTQLVDSVQAMTGMLAESQKEIMALQAQLAQQLAAREPHAAPEPPVDPLVSGLQQLWLNGDYERAIITWLQSDRRTDLFDLFFYNVEPTLLRDVNPIVTVSVAACISENLDSHLAQRMDWLQSALSFLETTQDADVAQHAPRVMETILNRLTETYMERSQTNRNDAMLGRFHPLFRLGKDIQLKFTMQTQAMAGRGF